MRLAIMDKQLHNRYAPQNDHIDDTPFIKVSYILKNTTVFNICQVHSIRATLRPETLRKVYFLYLTPGVFTRV